MNKDLKITDKILENFNKEIVPHMKDNGKHWNSLDNKEQKRILNTLKKIFDEIDSKPLDTLGGTKRWLNNESSN
tara:strand:- start:1631 stop:1852 length:222 start_codon:yes stop_codon:yes gene_type:complete